MALFFKNPNCSGLHSAMLRTTPSTRQRSEVDSSPPIAQQFFFHRVDRYMYLSCPNRMHTLNPPNELVKDYAKQFYGTYMSHPMNLLKNSGEVTGSKETVTRIINHALQKKRENIWTQYESTSRVFPHQFLQTCGCILSGAIFANSRKSAQQTGEQCNPLLATRDYAAVFCMR
ncbi:hypothetical protein BC830DRAFT_648257 [Chytriomyces sp. MP71]|nr:hypothetical protein BC830DRAFT_648257 [Chytriomyces sp. MP71]